MTKDFLMFKRLLIANRGEIAARIIRAAKALGIETVAIYSQADQYSPHLKLADKTVCIGASQSIHSYLNMEAILQAALQNNCHAIHPGFGFLAENAVFSSLCDQYKITFIGPTAQSINAMGDKANARRTMKKFGVSIIPGSDGVVNISEAKELSEKIGYPVLLKATAGGGGRGMRICNNPKELEENFIEASREAEKAFGNAGLYLEKYITAGRHIEFQILGDSYGKVIHLGERECSVQRHHQKLLEESPSPIISPETRQKIGEKLTTALKKIGYRSAGTMELFMDVATQELYFMEMNTRLQVEHPVTEMITGQDIVQEQIKIAANHPLKINQENITWKGHAIEFRINAEDPQKNFQRTPGTITKFQPPQSVSNAKIRLETFVEEGYSIPVFYDSMICKLIIQSENRAQTIAAAKEALSKFVIEGVPTTIDLHLKILENPDFCQGNYNTNLLKNMGILH